MFSKGIEEGNPPQWIQSEASPPEPSRESNVHSVDSVTVNSKPILIQEVKKRQKVVKAIDASYVDVLMRVEGSEKLVPALTDSGCTGQIHAQGGCSSFNLAAQQRVLGQQRQHLTIKEMRYRFQESLIQQQKSQQASRQGSLQEGRERRLPSP